MLRVTNRNYTRPVIHQENDKLDRSTSTVSTYNMQRQYKRAVGIERTAWDKAETGFLSALRRETTNDQKSFLSHCLNMTYIKRAARCEIDSLTWLSHRLLKYGWHQRPYKLTSLFDVTRTVRTQIGLCIQLCGSLFCHIVASLTFTLWPIYKMAV